MWCIKELIFNRESRDYFITPFILGVNLKGTVTIVDYDTGKELTFDKLSALKYFRPLGLAEIREKTYTTLFCFKVISKMCYDFLSYIDAYSTPLRGSVRFDSISLSSKCSEIDSSMEYFQATYKGGSVLKPISGTNFVLWNSGFGVGATLLTIFEVYGLFATSASALAQRDTINLITKPGVKTIIKLSPKCRTIYAKYKTLRKGD